MKTTSKLVCPYFRSSKINNQVTLTRILKAVDIKMDDVIFMVDDNFKLIGYKPYYLSDQIKLAKYKKKYENHKNIPS